MLKVAKADQKAHRGKTTHCIVLRGLQIAPNFSISDGQDQLNAGSIQDALREVEAATARTLKVNSIFP